MGIDAGKGNLVYSPQLPQSGVNTQGRRGPEGASMKKYVCTVCGWVYDPAEHDNVAFEDLPDDWTCPVCGVGKDQFQEA